MRNNFFYIKKMKSYKIITITHLLLFITLIQCTNPTKPQPIVNQNECTQYYCPMHKDKTSTHLDECSECLNPMIINKLNEDSLISKNETMQSMCDSFACYQTRILFSSKKIENDTVKSKEKNKEQVLMATATFLKSVNIHEVMMLAESMVQREKNKEHHLSIKKYQAEAEIYIKEITKELKKENPDYEKIKKISKKLNDCTEKISKESSYLKY
jgi:regulator of sirC expression with transglutaminase-like and TPR domain